MASDLVNGQGPHPFTQSLLERASRAGEAVDRSRVEYAIHRRAGSLGIPGHPVIKWHPDPQSAFDRLCRYDLVDLLQMQDASFWRQESYPAMDDEALERWCHARRLATEQLRPDDHDRALMAPKLAARRHAPTGSPTSVFEARGVAAQIGWLETSITDATVEALCRIEILMSHGMAEGSEPVHHQLGVIEAHEHGLLATWETPAELICIPARSTTYGRPSRLGERSS